MRQVTTILALAMLAACGADQPEQVTDAAPVNIDAEPKRIDDGFEGGAPSPMAPAAIRYRIIGTPVVGSPTTIELKVQSVSDASPVTLEYRLRGTQALVLAESQPAMVSLDPSADGEYNQRVTIIPQRDGRHYLNVRAVVSTPDGNKATIIAVPIQVGTGTRELVDNGELRIDEDGNAVRVLKEN